MCMEKEYDAITVRINKDLDKGFDYRRIVIEGLPE